MRGPAEVASLDPADSALLVAVTLALGSIGVGLLYPDGSLILCRLQSQQQQRHQRQQQQREQQPQQNQELRHTPYIAGDTVRVFSRGSLRWAFTLLWLRKAESCGQGGSSERLEIRLSSGILLYTRQAILLWVSACSSLNCASPPGRSSLQLLLLAAMRRRTYSTSKLEAFCPEERSSTQFVSYISRLRISTVPPESTSIILPGRPWGS